MEAPVCFCCGCIHPYVEEVAEKGAITWYQPLQHGDTEGALVFLGQSLQTIQELLWLQVYLSRYNVVKEGKQPLRDHESFDDWSLTLPQLDGEFTRRVISVYSKEKGKERATGSEASKFQGSRMWWRWHLECINVWR